MAALLENLRYDPTANSSLSLADGANSSEGKFGIPRFAGDPAALQAYSFRVTVRQSREKMMDKTEGQEDGSLGSSTHRGSQRRRIQAGSTTQH